MKKTRRSEISRVNSTELRRIKRTRNVSKNKALEGFKTSAGFYKLSKSPIDNSRTLVQYGDFHGQNVYGDATNNIIKLGKNSTYIEHSLDAIDKSEIDLISQGKFDTSPNDVIKSLISKYRARSSESRMKSRNLGASNTDEECFQIKVNNALAPTLHRTPHTNKLSYQENTYNNISQEPEVFRGYDQENSYISRKMSLNSEVSKIIHKARSNSQTRTYNPYRMHCSNLKDASLKSRLESPSKGDPYLYAQERMIMTIDKHIPRDEYSDLMRKERFSHQLLKKHSKASIVLNMAKDSPKKLKPSRDFYTSTNRSPSATLKENLKFIRRRAQNCKTSQNSKNPPHAHKKALNLAQVCFEEKCNLRKLKLRKNLREKTEKKKVVLRDLERGFSEEEDEFEEFKGIEDGEFLQQTDTDQSLLNNHMKEEPEETDPESPTNRIHLQKETQGAKEFDIFEEANKIKVAEEKENEKERKSGIKRSLCRNINREYLQSFNSKKFPIQGITDINGVDGAPYLSYNPRGKPRTKLDKGVYKHLLKNLDDKKIPTFIVNRKREFLFENKSPF
ncbi:unnamed protein product [Moneuplotes crassus]|uniref:Uncharacterized protein n=1 Tax=Euplotes crassus TaxID=5936 RepID=A0AAD2D7L8_EUPCR|nr:unnamed protein product [Moneuplotes crassus]